MLRESLTAMTAGLRDRVSTLLSPERQIHNSDDRGDANDGPSAGYPALGYSFVSHSTPVIADNRQVGASANWSGDQPISSGDHRRALHQDFADAALQSSLHNAANWSTAPSAAHNSNSHQSSRNSNGFYRAGPPLPHSAGLAPTSSPLSLPASAAGAVSNGALGRASDPAISPSHASWDRMGSEYAVQDMEAVLVATADLLESQHAGLPKTIGVASRSFNPDAAPPQFDVPALSHSDTASPGRDVNVETLIAQMRQRVVELQRQNQRPG